MHCPHCRKRLPKQDDTICPHCGKSILQGYGSYTPTAEEIRRVHEANKTEKKTRTISIADYVALIGTALTILGWGTVLLYPLPLPENRPALLSYESLDIAGFVSGILGILVLAVSFAWSMYVTHSASRTMTKKERGFTILDVMSLGAGFPEWWKWWYNLIPPLIFIVLSRAKVLQPLVAGILFFGYAGVVILYLYLSARRWTAKQNISNQQ